MVWHGDQLQEHFLACYWQGTEAKGTHTINRSEDKLWTCQNSIHEWRVPVPVLLRRRKWLHKHQKRGSPFKRHSGTRSNQRSPADARTMNHALNTRVSLYIHALFCCVCSSHTLTTDTSSTFLSVMSVTCMTKTEELSLVATIHVDCLAFGFRPWFLSMVASLSCYWTMHTITRWQILRIKVFFECQEHRPVISVALNDHEWLRQHDFVLKPGVRRPNFDLQKRLVS